MASHMDAPGDSNDDSQPTSKAKDDSQPTSEASEDPIERHLQSALDSRDDDVARYHLREALQLQVAEMHGV